MPEMPTLPHGWTLNVLAGWPLDQFAHWPPLERAGNVLLPEAFTGIAHPDDNSDVLFLCFRVQDGEVQLTTVMSSRSDVHTALDRLRRAAPMETWRRLCIVGMARFLATADPEDLAMEDAQMGVGGMRSEWEKAAREWQSQLQGWGQLNAERAEKEPIRRKRNRITRDHLEKVAHVYRQADADGAPPTKAVAERFDTSHSTAAKWVSQARRQGILGPPPGSRGGEVSNPAAAAAARPAAEAAARPLASRVNKIVADSMKQGQAGEGEE
ncbi:hypothetical protein ACI3K5_03920 [Streptomyces sp. MPA0124]|uniref:hypothetical protein n=1 Tax=Streptomyces sp. MPA0124 TaxID=3378069 RepID=UPI003853A953